MSDSESNRWSDIDTLPLPQCAGRKILGSAHLGKGLSIAKTKFNLSKAMQKNKANNELQPRAWSRNNQLIF